MSHKNTPEQAALAKIRAKESLRRHKEAIKERIRVSNENEKNGLPPDQWVVEFRAKNNAIKAKWKQKLPKKEIIRKANSGSFKKGLIPKNKLSPEQKEISLERARERTREWHRQNKDRVNELARERRKDVNVRIKCNLRKRLSFLLRKNIVSKTEQTLDLLGIPFTEFMLYLESKFQVGMSFDNYGEWHLDHIVPCYYFDLTKFQDRQKCFHYTNIQPLWAKDNLVKNKRLV